MMLLSYDLLLTVIVTAIVTVNSNKWSGTHDLPQAKTWNPTLTQQQQRQQPPPVFLTSTRQPVQQRQLQQKKEDGDGDTAHGNNIDGNGRSFDGSKGSNDPLLTPSSMSPDHYQSPYNSRPYFNGYVQRFDQGFPLFPSEHKYGPGYRKDKYGHGYGYSCKQGDDCDKVKEAVNQIPTVSPHSVSSHRPYQPFLNGHFPNPMNHQMLYPPYENQQFPPDGRFYDMRVSPYPTRYLYDQPQQPQPEHPQSQHPQSQHPQSQHPQSQHPQPKHPQAQHPQLQHSQVQHPLPQHPQSQHPRQPHHQQPQPHDQQQILKD